MANFAEAFRDAVPSRGISIIMNDLPIGVFDSGMGGLSVWREIRRLLPHESIIYYGDGANCPYGEKPAEQVVGFIDKAVDTLLDRGAKLIVLACNTATMTAVAHLRATRDVPFVGMEPAVKPAAASTRSGTIGVLATRTTIGSEWFARLRDRYSDKARIVSSVGEGFVEAVEAGQTDTPQTGELVRRAVAPFIAAGVDRIVLGCTHYPFLAVRIREAVGPEVEIIDPAPAVARRVASLLAAGDMAAGADHEAEYEFLSAAGESYSARLRACAAEIVAGGGF